MRPNVNTDTNKQMSFGFKVQSTKWVQTEMEI